MDRVKRVTYFIEQFYELHKNLSNEELAETFYDFLVSKEDDAACTIADYCSMSIEDIDAHKEDMMLDIMLNYYKFIRCYDTENKISEKEKELLKRFDDEEFEAIDLVYYFAMEENKEQIKEMINQYCIFKTQGSGLISSVDEYNAQHPTPFLSNLTRHIDYVNTCDAIAKMYNDTVNEHMDDDDFEDVNDFEDEEVCCGTTVLDDEYDYEFEDWAINLAADVLAFIQSKYHTAKEFESFVRYYISLIYATLLVQREERLVTEQIEELLKAIERRGATAESIMALFQKNDNFFLGIELVSQEYADTKGTLFDLRHQFEDEKSNRIFKMLDPSYPLKTEEPEQKDNAPFVVIGSLIDKMDEVLLHFKLRYPDDFEDKIYVFLLSEFCPDDGILYEHDIDEKSNITFKLLTIRYLARKFYEYHASREIIDLTMGESYLFQALAFADKSTENMIKLFYDGGIAFLHAYFDLMDEPERVEKNLIRSIIDRKEMKTMVKIDPLCILDELIHKTVNQGPLYTILEEDGVGETVNYLRIIEVKRPLECEDNIGELLTEVYDILKRKKDLEDTDEILLKYIENDSWTSREYKKDLMINEQLLRVLLSRYLLSQTDCEYDMYRAKDEGYQKIKQRLQREKKQDNQNT